MALDWGNQPPESLGDLFARLVRLVASVQDVKLIKRLPDASPILLTAGAVGTLVPHGETRKAPKSVVVQLVGDGPSTAVTTVGEITATHVRIFSTATVQVELAVYL